MRLLAVLFLLTALTGCKPTHTASATTKEAASLLEARGDFTTRLKRRDHANDAVPQPPEDMFRIVRYTSPAGELSAYVTPPKEDNAKHPAIIWLFGGFSNGIGETAWEDAPTENDQSARAFREAGIVMMYPSLRGGNKNPGVREGFYGEVNDVLAARDFLSRQPNVDPERIYLGGHSTGGTLALLVAASSDRFRAVFSFGPVDEVVNYGQEVLPFDITDTKEADFRAPIKWLDSIHNPTFVFEGGDKQGNIGSLRVLAKANRNPVIHIEPVPGTNHFSVLAPVTRVLARKIVEDNGPTSIIKIDAKDLQVAVKP
ncbi:prolyl oligopeptidase family serine peptidase [Luteolibacter ambystomatis]|uniref:Prolyl oligopeptidase family serine peptidase n=1 Tax=Luteolibacter ambystomatis TaxID=2824561 RepID=A0A975J1Y9_9BACT|nr:prolyl oligopeptidase family serine peptidase [Luteolibacter ambystomatis]QUE52502.1 prolyl oligopeptidase family serine peptidase [Luteolibacter ambystomatis]